MVELLEKLRQGSLRQGVAYSYAHLCGRLGIPPEKIEDPALYQKGLELIASGYTPMPIEPQKPTQLSNLEQVAEENTQPKTVRKVGSKEERIAAFLEAATPVMNNPDAYGAIDRVDILMEYFPKFIIGGSQPLVLPGEIVGKDHQFRTYESMQIKKIFRGVYEFYSKKAQKKQSD